MNYAQFIKEIGRDNLTSAPFDPTRCLRGGA